MTPTMRRARATCFAYGQTGSGKTHTMLGSDESNDGLYVLAAGDLFARLAHAPPQIKCFVAFFEIYGGKLFDLLGQRAQLHARDNGQGEVRRRARRAVAAHLAASAPGHHSRSVAARRSRHGSAACGR